MKTLLIILMLVMSTTAHSQSEVLKAYRAADSLLIIGLFSESYERFKVLETTCDKEDTLYPHILWYTVIAVSELERQLRMKEKFNESLQYGLEALALIEKGRRLFPDYYVEKEFFMHKSLVVSYYELGKLDKAQFHKDVLYKAYREKKLPKGLDRCFNFSYFTWNGNNIWGYEYYPELGDPETAGSFSKIVYYIYSTKPDGSDDEQLYRLHVLKFHKIDESIEFEYILTKYLEKATNEKSGSLYAYTYDRVIDYPKLQADIKEVLKGNYTPAKTR